LVVYSLSTVVPIFVGLLTFIKVGYGFNQNSDETLNCLDNGVAVGWVLYFKLELAEYRGVEEVVNRLQVLG
jgi:hypothetical protein